MSLISVKDLNFEYPRKRVLNDISFEIKEGSVTALVGPNGAGKTTLLRCMTSLETPLSGHVIVNGIDVHDQPRKAHQHMGYLSDFFGVYKNLTVKQCLTYMAWSQKVPTEGLDQKIAELAKEVDIEKYLDEKAGSLSRGYKQRLGVGLALVHNPKCIFLDEPASGMDPEARIKFSELMLRLKKKGMTIIVSSHILAELEDYCTDMIVLRDGEVKSHVILSDHQAAQNMTIQIALQSVKKEYTKLIEAYDGVSEMRTSEHGVVVAFTGDQKAQGEFLKHLVEKELPVYQFIVTQKTLKDAYMDLADVREVNVQ